MTGGSTAGASEPGRPARRARAVAWLRGEPLHVPSHALLVHFPAALLPASLVFDILARLDPDAGLARAATLLLGLGLAGGAAAAGTGLLDWVAMLPGPRRRRVTRHLLVQAAALAAFGVSLVTRGVELWPGAGTASLLASGLGLALILVGDHLGGLLVYRDGMRVGSRR
jgi:uncharacterized membrane protein